MMIILIAILCLLAALFILVFVIWRSTLTIKVDGLVDAETAQFSIKFGFWQKELFSFKADPAKIKKAIEELHESSMVSGEHHADQSIVKSLSDWYRLSLKTAGTIRSLHLSDKLCLSHFLWRTSFGSGDARDTAILCGMIWSAKSMIMPLIGKMSIDRPHVEVVPLFQEQRFASQFSCMMSLNVGEAISMMRKIRRQLKGGE
ncbi:DUF2953 domain-containing protein [Sporolactobacillus pectinivorans]|uniref:DUF2953 domain-containing protein n=1 Tax=Sporolactobacillus pectinivorans TaxID=1591408 RepID=UPI000C256E01|nr:DUF2953 domain-containing protein [Sporolactobacillus pectinivorans]